MPGQKGFTGTFAGKIAVAKRFGSLNTGTIAAAKIKILWMGKFRSRMFATAKTFTRPVAADFLSAKELYFTIVFLSLLLPSLIPIIY